MTPPRLLYVDDEQNNLDVFQAAYEDDYDVRTALSAKEAMAILREHPVDMIITDERMPQMTGVQFLEAVGSEYPNAVRAILTGYADIEAVIQAINAGRVDLYLTKPWNPVELKLSIDRALDLLKIKRRNEELANELEQCVCRARSMREAFQKYVPASVVDDALAAGPKANVMAGENRIVVVMFADIHEFERLYDVLPPTDLVRLLSRYFHVMNRVVLKHRGTVIETIANRLQAVFGAPVSTLENEQNAVNASRAMVQAIETFNDKEAIPLLGEPLRIGIGLNRGDVVAGNLGSLKRMKYGVAGDTVNVAARIQGETLGDRSDVLLGGSLKEWLAESETLEELPAVTLRGKKEKTALYRLVSR